jgi:hypothetical protein
MLGGGFERATCPTSGPLPDGLQQCQCVSTYNSYPNPVVANGILAEHHLKGEDAWWAEDVSAQPEP